MTEFLEEVHLATMANPRATAEFGVLCEEGEKLCVFGWDGWPVLMEKPSNHRMQRATWSTKHHGNSFSRLEGCNMEERPVFALLLSSSVSPRSTDESICFYQLMLEAVTGLQGGLTAVLVGLKGYCMVHILDNGFR